MIKPKEIVLFDQTFCSICKSHTDGKPLIIPAGIYYYIICEDCSKKFSLEEIDLMANMFIAYGGYFGKEKKSNFKLLDALMSIDKTVNGNFKKKTVFLMHKSLLHGIPIHEFHKVLELAT